MVRQAMALVMFVALGNVATAQPPKEFKGHTDHVYSVEFSPKGDLMATGSFDKTIKLWDFKTGKEKMTLKGHTDQVYCVAFSPDGNLLASGSKDKTIRLWNVKDGTLFKELKGHTDVVQSVAFSPDGNLLASGSGDKSVRLWNVKDGKELKNLGANGGSVYTVAFSPDGSLLASVGQYPEPVGGKPAPNTATIKIWDVKAQKELKVLGDKDKDKDSVMVVAFLGNDKLVTGGGDKQLHIWDVSSGKEIKKMGKTDSDIFGLAISKDGKQAVTAGYGGHLNLWDLESGKSVFSTKVTYMKGKKANPDMTYCVTFTPDGSAVVSGGEQQLAVVTSLKEKK